MKYDTEMHSLFRQHRKTAKNQFGIIEKPKKQMLEIIVYCIVLPSGGINYNLIPRIITYYYHYHRHNVCSTIR